MEVLAVPEANHKDSYFIHPFASNLDDILFYHENESIQKEYETLILKEYYDDNIVKQKNIFCKIPVKLIRNGVYFDGNAFYTVGKVISISKDSIEVITSSTNDLTGYTYIPLFIYDDNGYVAGIDCFIVFKLSNTVSEFLRLFTKLKTPNMINDFVEHEQSKAKLDVSSTFNFGNWSSE